MHRKKYQCPGQKAIETFCPDEEQGFVLTGKSCAVLRPVLASAKTGRFDWDHKFYPGP
jgi:hypothetical protein